MNVRPKLVDGTDAGDHLKHKLLPGRLAHIGIVTHRPSNGRRPMMVHNIGAGTRLEDVLFAFEITGHFRFPPTAA